MLYWCPGALVEVVEIPGMEVLVKRPPCSRVGLVSCKNLPFTVSLGLKTWSILIMSSRKLKVLPRLAMYPNGLPAEAKLGEGNLEKMSLTYAAATGSIDVMLVP